MTMTTSQDLAFAAFQTAHRVYSLPSIQADPHSRQVAAEMLQAAIAHLEVVADQVDYTGIRLPS